MWGKSRGVTSHTELLRYLGVTKILHHNYIIKYYIIIILRKYRKLKKHPDFLSWLLQCATIVDASTLRCWGNFTGFHPWCKRIMHIRYVLMRLCFRFRCVVHLNLRSEVSSDKTTSVTQLDTYLVVCWIVSYGYLVYYLVHWPDCFTHFLLYVL